MRILHTADWHFGKTLEGRDRIAEQDAFVDELIAICKNEAVDLVLMAGDVYQTVNPSAEAERLFYRALDGLSADGTRGVVVIAGNHDHAERINAARPLADKLGIVLMGFPKDALAATAPAEGRVQRVAAGAGYVELKIPGCAEHAVISTVPYPSEARLNEVLAKTLDEQELQSHYSERIGEWFRSLSGHFRPDTVNLAVSHVYVQGGDESESEIQIQIGGAYAVHPDAFPETAQYVALGHLHRPQNVKGAKAPTRYAGSPLSYSFSEAGQTKSVTIVDAFPGRQASFREVQLKSGKPLVRWNATGGIAQVEEWVAEGRDENAWIDLAVHVKTGLDLEHIHHLRDLHPGFVQIHPVLPVSANKTGNGTAAAAVGLPIDEVFRKFFAERTKTQADEEIVELFLRLVTETDAESAAPDEQSADEQGADGQGADGQGADGQGADGQGADGQGADGQGADGQGADEQSADEQSAQDDGGEVGA